jgi:hypothetical protein
MVAAGVLVFPVSVAVTLPVVVAPQTGAFPLLQYRTIEESKGFVTWLGAAQMGDGRPVTVSVTGGIPSPPGRE